MGIWIQSGRWEQMVNVLGFIVYFKYKIKSLKMMDEDKCPLCKKTPIQPINLKCQHHPCFSCASKIMTIDNESQLEIKYRIVCPSCKKKTLTYDIRHLIISITEQDEDMYVTTKYIKKKPQVCVRYPDERPSQSFGHSKKNSIQSIINNGTIKYKKQIEVECRSHSGHILEYFCYDCHKKNYKTVFQCNQCYKKHKNQHKHKVLTLRQGLEKLSSYNKNKVQNGIPTKKKQIEQIHHSLTFLQESVNSQYEKIYKELNDQFKAIYQTLNEKYQNIRKYLKTQFLKQCQEIKNCTEINRKLKESFRSLEKMQSATEDAESQINFYIYFKQIEEAIQNNSSKINKTLDLPKLVKKTTLFHQILNEFIEVSFGSQIQSSVGPELVPKSHNRHLSYGSTPLGSARNLSNYASQKYDSTKKNSNDETWKLGKQNFRAITPKGALIFDFNKLTL